MVFVKPLIYIKFILFFLEQTTLNFFQYFSSVMENNSHLLNYCTMLQKSYGNVFRQFFYFKLMSFFSFSAHQMVCNAQYLLQE